MKQASLRTIGRHKSAYVILHTCKLSTILKHAALTVKQACLLHSPMILMVADLGIICYNSTCIVLLALAAQQMALSLALACTALCIWLQQ